MDTQIIGFTLMVLALGELIVSALMIYLMLIVYMQSGGQDDRPVNYPAALGGLALILLFLGARLTSLAVPLN